MKMGTGAHEQQDLEERAQEQDRPVPGMSALIVKGQ